MFKYYMIISEETKASYLNNNSYQFTVFSLVLIVGIVGVGLLMYT